VDGIEYTGFAATSLATLAFLPQVIKTWRARSAHDFSLVTLLMLVAGTILWVFYGLLRGAPAIWLGNSVTLLLTAVILAVKLRGARTRAPDAAATGRSA
jgi:MtN3 and saliva related transmembrane protein